LLAHELVSIVAVKSWPHGDGKPTSTSNEMHLANTQANFHSRFENALFLSFNSTSERSPPRAAIQLVAYVQLSASAPLIDPTPQLRRHCQEWLPPAAVPSTLRFVECLPLLTSGKVDRSALPPPRSNAMSTSGDAGNSIAYLFWSLLCFLDSLVCCLCIVFTCSPSFMCLYIPPPPLFLGAQRHIDSFKIGRPPILEVTLLALPARTHNPIYE